MKIKKYQNPSGTLTPEREAEIRARQQAAVDEIWKQRKEYAEQEEQERKQQLKEEIKRVTAENAAKTAHLDNGSSATDWYYALQDDPQKRAEWDRGATLTTLAGLGTVAAPYLLYGMGSMGGAIYRGLNNPITRTAVKQAGTKAGISTLTGEVIDRLSYGTRDYINNSSIGNTNLNRYFVRPTLSIVPLLGIDDAAAGLANQTRKLNSVHADVFGPNAPMSRVGRTHLQGPGQGTDIKVDVGKKSSYKGQPDEWTSTSIRKVGPSSHLYHKQMINTFGLDVIEEAFPFLDKYLEGIHPSLHDAAKRAYLSDMLSGDAFRANGTGILPSGSEITKRALARTKNYGNDGLVLLRSASEEHLENPLQKMYAFLSEPGMADKYVLTDNGTKLKGLMDSDKWKAWQKLVQESDIKKQQILTELQKSIGSKNREGAINWFKQLVDIESRLPSGVQRFNARNPMPDKWKKDFATIAETLGDQYISRLENPSEYPLQHGLEFVIGDRRIEPLIMKDDATALFFPQLQHIDEKSKLSFPEYVKMIAETPEYRAIAREIASRYPNITSSNVYTDNLLETIAPEGLPSLADVLITYGPDGTEGLKGVPIIMTTSDGVLKSIGSKANGEFDSTVKSVFKKKGGRIPSVLKKGGNVPSYLKFFKGN